MNISSLIITLKDENFTAQALQELKKIQECEIITHENAKIIVVITTDEIDKEIAIFRKIEAIQGVGLVSMAYSYQEDIEFNKDKSELGGGLKKIQADETLDAKHIIYNGHIGSKTLK